MYNISLSLTDLWNDMIDQLSIYKTDHEINKHPIDINTKDVIRTHSFNDV